MKYELKVETTIQVDPLDIYPELTIPAARDEANVLLQDCRYSVDCFDFPKASEVVLDFIDEIDHWMPRVVSLDLETMCHNGRKPKLICTAVNAGMPRSYETWLR